MQPDAGHSSPLGPSSPRPAGWRGSRWLAIVELILVALIFLADFEHHIYISKTLYLLVLAAVSLRVRRVSWRTIGFRVPRNWPRTLAAGLATGLALEAFQLFVSQPLLARLFHRQPDLHDFQDLVGNWQLTLVGIALAWTLAAFGEELVYRGYLMNRVADLGNGSPRAWIVSLLVVHIGFGLAHAYQGPTGVVNEGLAGLLLGVIYLCAGRDLSVPILAHGITDTVDLVLIFLGKFPGM